MRCKDLRAVIPTLLTTQPCGQKRHQSRKHTNYCPVTAVISLTEKRHRCEGKEGERRCINNEEILFRGSGKGLRSEGKQELGGVKGSLEAGDRRV